MNQENENTQSNHSVDNYKSIVEFAEKEIEKVFKYYKWAVSTVGLIIIAGMFFTYNSFSGLKDDIRESKKDLKADVDNTLNRIKSELEVETDAIKKEINAKIEQEFDEENIRKLVEQKAKERIDIIADKIIDSKINEKITPKVEESLKKIKEIEKRISEDKEFIYDVTKVVGEIASILPHATGYGAGLTQEEKKLLNDYSEYLKNRLQKIKN